MSNIECLKKLLAAFLKDVEPLKNFQWSGATADHSFQMIQRAAIIRQWEALHAQIALSNTGHGHFGVTFVRPGYEELVWIEYLMKFPKHADRITLALAVGSGAKSVIQQQKYLGKNQMQKIGWNDASLRFHHIKAEIAKNELSTLGENLGWPKVPPSFRWMSEKVGRGKEYDFLYHGSSSYVHFSAHELLRRVWGQHGNVRIGSSTFSKYWEEFAAYWGGKTFTYLLMACIDIWFHENDDGDEKERENIVKIIEFFQPVPIVTPEEFEAWLEPNQQ